MYFEIKEQSNKYKCFSKEKMWKMYFKQKIPNSSLKEKLNMPVKVNFYLIFEGSVLKKFPTFFFTDNSIIA